MSGIAETARRLTSSATVHDRGEWLTVMRFGLGTLLGNQTLLTELIIDRAAREKSHDENDGDADTARLDFYVVRLMNELGITITEAE